MNKDKKGAKEVRVDPHGDNKIADSKGTFHPGFLLIPVFASRQPGGH